MPNMYFVAPPFQKIRKDYGLQPIGVYVYVITFIDIDGKAVQNSSTVTLVM